MTKPTNDTDLFREAQTGQDKREHQKIVNRVFISAGDSIWPPLYQLRMSLYRPLNPLRFYAYIPLTTALLCCKSPWTRAMS